MSFSPTCLALKVKNHVYFFCSCNPQISVKCLTLEQFSSVQLLSHIRLFATPWTSAHQVSLSITNSWSLLKLQGAWMVGDAIQPSHPLSSPSPPVLNLSQHHGLFLTNQFFASGGQSIGVSASASVLPMNIQD